MKINGTLIGLQYDKKDKNNDLPPTDDSFFKLSGDEYYWQHQEQLQVSELTFDSTIEAQKKRLLSKSYSNSPCPHSVSQVDNIVKVTTSSDLTKLTLKPQITQATYQPLEPVNSFNAKKSNLTHCAETVQKLTDKNINASALKKETLTLGVPQELKKYHLYRGDKDAELTLNTVDLEKKEEKELIDTIKTYLRKKGLTLKKMIINGAQHD